MKLERLSPTNASRATPPHMMNAGSTSRTAENADKKINTNNKKIEKLESEISRLEGEQASGSVESEKHLKKLHP